MCIEELVDRIGVGKDGSVRAHALDGNKCRVRAVYF